MIDTFEELGYIPGVSPEAFDKLYTRRDVCNLLQRASCCRTKEDEIWFNKDISFSKLNNYPYVKDDMNGKMYMVYSCNINKPWPYVSGCIILTEDQFNKYFTALT